MKKIAFIMAVVCVAALSAHATLVGWNQPMISTGLTDPNSSPDPLVQQFNPLGLSGNGTQGGDWLVEVLLGGSAIYSSSAANLGWYDAYGSFVINGFTFNANTESVVTMVLYDNALGAVGNYSWLESAALTLPADTWSPNPMPGDAGDLSPGFDFSAASWQAIPEPATALLMVFGGMGAFILRRSKMKSQEEEG